MVSQKEAAVLVQVAGDFFKLRALEGSKGFQMFVYVDKRTIYPISGGQ
jgi:hypothetical protein